MKHVRIATYEIKRGSFQELADVAQDGMLREFRNQPGFIRYGLADSGDKTCVSLSLWETRKDADHAVDEWSIGPLGLHHRREPDDVGVERSEPVEIGRGNGHVVDAANHFDHCCMSVELPALVRVAERSLG